MKNILKKVNKLITLKLQKTTQIIMKKKRTTLLFQKLMQLNTENILLYIGPVIKVIIRSFGFF